MTAPTSSRSDAVANRARLIEAAHAVFSERGGQAEMKEIAERAGVGIGTIYRNFATKDDLLRAIKNTQLTTAVEMIERLSAESDPRSVLGNLISKMLMQAEENLALCQAIMGGPGGPPKEPEDFARLLDALVVPIRMAQEAGACRTDLPAEFLAQHVLFQFQSYLQLREQLPASEVLERVIKLFLSSIAPESV